jgi:hypothetical protein
MVLPSVGEAAGQQVEPSIINNRIEGLERPTLDHIARFIFERVRQLGPVTRVTGMASYADRSYAASLQLLNAPVKAGA